MPSLGRKYIPPLPFETILTDRSNGKTYKVGRSGSNPTVSEITTIDPNRYWVYEAFTGPTILDDKGRPYELYVDGGTMGFEKI